jgi:uncharacterized protein YkwD
MRSLLLLVLLLVPLASETENKAARVELNDDEKALLEMLNRSRAEAKLPPLKLNAKLCKIARAHSANMLKQKKLDHELDGKRVKHRAADAGYDYRIIAENIAYGENEREKEPITLKEIHDGWMKSAAHRKNILNKRFEEVGLGVAGDKKALIYFTQVFGTPSRD